MKLIMFILLFLLVGGFFIISNENIKINNKENLDVLIKLYGTWFDQLIDNSRTAVGYAVKMEWLPDQGLIDEG